MVKITSIILTLCYCTVLLISCSISEEITFNEEGSLNYSYVIDASEFMKIMPDSMDKNMFKDTLISFKDLLTQKKDSISHTFRKSKKITSAKTSFY